MIERSVFNNILTTNATNIRKCSLEGLYRMYKDYILSMKDWSDILMVRYGLYNIPDLYKILNWNIDYYDKSLLVNSFYYKDKLYWIDKDTRVSLQHLINCGADNITLQLNDTTYINISATKLQEFLKALEVYAAKCFTVTAKHKLDVDKLSSIEELELYDYTSGYPDKITLNED